MRTNEQRIAALHSRAAEIEREDRQHRVQVMQASSVLACFALVVLLASLMPGFAGTMIPELTPGTGSASVFSGSSALGFIVVGTVAFMLGAAVTIFCYRLKGFLNGNTRRPEERR